jgi:hypothetical protein
VRTTSPGSQDECERIRHSERIEDLMRCQCELPSFSVTGGWKYAGRLVVWGVDPKAEDRRWCARNWCRITGSSGQPWEERQFKCASHERRWFRPDNWRVGAGLCVQVRGEDSRALMGIR